MSKFKRIVSTFSLALCLALVLGLLSPITVNALGGIKDRNPTKDDPVYGNNGVVKNFTQVASDYYNYYTRLNSNRLYKTYYEGIVIYSPVPTKGLINTTSFSGWENIYENYNIVRDPQTKHLANFKPQTIPLGTARKDAIRDGGSSTRVIKDSRGNTIVQSGEWRYLGYSSQGDAMTNPYFPPDAPTNTTYYNYGYQENPWKILTGIISGKSQWDDPESVSYYLKLGVVRQAIDSYTDQMLSTSDARRWSTMSESEKAGKVNWWVNKLSLRTDPVEMSALFVGGKLDKNGVNWYRSIALAKKDVRNLSVTKLQVQSPDGVVMGNSTRVGTNESYTKNPIHSVVRGNSYKVLVTVTNTTAYDTILNPSRIKFGTTYEDSKAYSTKLNFEDHNWQTTLTKPQIIKANSSITFETTYTVPGATQNYIRFHALIDNDHYLNNDNIEDQDDRISLILGAKNAGDLSATSTSLINENGNEVTSILPGRKYKIRFTATYKGDTIYAYDSRGNATTPNKKFSISGTYTRALPQGGSEAITKTIAKNEPIVNGRTYSFETPYMVLEMPYLSTSFTIDSSAYEQGFNSNQKNDTWTKTWAEDYDLSVSNVRLVPKKDYNVKTGDMKFGVIYDVKYKTPSSASSHEVDSSTIITIGSNSFTFVDHLKSGDNKNITHEITLNMPSPATTNIQATVLTNANKYVWEKDLTTQANNKQTSNVATVSRPANPFNTGISVNTENKWSQQYNIHNWKGTYVSYSANGRDYGFYLYSQNGADTTQTKEQKESYKITRVLFKSKLTEDLKLGRSRDGWVNLTSGEEAKIKAGYGYELKIDVEYNTNAFSTEPTASVSGGNGNWVRPQNVTPNLPDEIYVKTADNKIYSVSGLNGTTSAFEASRSGDRNKTTWTYSLKSSNTLGIKSTSKIYIGENVSNGEYNLQVFTPSIPGVPTKTYEKSLQDSYIFKIKVVGSSTDDIKDHIVQ